MRVLCSALWKKQKDWPHLRSFAEVHKLWRDWSIKVSFLFFSLCLLLFQSLWNLDVKKLMTLKWKFIEHECITQWVTDFDIMLSEKICKEVQPNRMNRTRIWQPLMSYMIKLTSHFRDGLKLLRNTKWARIFMSNLILLLLRIWDLKKKTKHECF